MPQSSFQKYRKFIFVASLIPLVIYLSFTFAWRTSISSAALAPYITEIKKAPVLPVLMYEMYLTYKTEAIAYDCYKYLYYSYDQDIKPPICLQVAQQIHFRDAQARRIASINTFSLAQHLYREIPTQQMFQWLMMNSDFGTGKRGVMAAAELYFQKSLFECNEVEIASLVILSQNPSLYHPSRHPERLAEAAHILVVKHRYKDGFFLETNP